MAKNNVIANLHHVTERIEKACGKAGRDINSVRIVAVTKGVSIEMVNEIIRYGHKDLGENRVREAYLKSRNIKGDIIWHMVGHLQTNKVRDAVRLFSYIHSVDSVRLAEKINSEASKIGKIQDILIEVNTSGEMTKFGLKPKEVRSFIKGLSSFGNIHICGFMTVPPLADGPEEVRPYFSLLRRLKEQFQLEELSMGMSQDFEIAVEEGATMVRIGRAIFCGKL